MILESISVLRLIIGVFIVAIVYITPLIIVQHGELLTMYKIILASIYVLHDVCIMFRTTWFTYSFDEL